MFVDDRAVGAAVLSGGDSFAAVSTVDDHYFLGGVGRDELVLEELIHIAFADPIHPTEPRSAQQALFDVAQHGERVELEHSRDLLRGEDLVLHS